MKLTRTVIKAILEAVFATQPVEIGCDECFEQVHRFAEMELAGEDAASALPLVQSHLERCRDCREEFEMLLAALRAVAGNNSPK
ncbi:MAG: hypothetical protein WD021_01430 [Rhodothermales bacterium]